MSKAGIVIMPHLVLQYMNGNYNKHMLNSENLSLYCKGFIMDQQDFITLSILSKLFKLIGNFTKIDHFTVVCLVAWPLNESEAEFDLVLIETSLLFLC